MSGGFSNGFSNGFDVYTTPGGSTIAINRRRRVAILTYDYINKESI